MIPLLRVRISWLGADTQRLAARSVSCPADTSSRRKIWVSPRDVCGNSCGVERLKDGQCDGPASRTDPTRTRGGDPRNPQTSLGIRDVQPSDGLFRARPACLPLAHSRWY